MATDTATETAEGFGRVSQLRGVVFRYVSFTASVIGLVVLAALLAIVVVDAFGLAEAGPQWYLAYGLTVGLPIVALVGHGARNRTFGSVGAGITATLVGGGLTAGGLAVLFVVLDPQLWFLYYTLALLPAAIVYVFGRRHEDARTPFAAAAAFFVGLGIATYTWYTLSTYPVDWVIHVWTLAVPAATAIGYTAGQALDRRWAVVAALAVVVGAAVVGAGLDSLTAFDPSAGVILFMSVVVPAGVYGGRTLVVREDGRLGLLVPVVVVVGALVGRVLVEVLDATQPEPWLDWQFLTSAPSRFPEQAGLYPAIIGSIFIIALVAVFSFVLGVGAAIYLEEYATGTGTLGTVTRIIRINISNLAGVPSVVYGLLGLGVFVNLVGLGFGTVIVAALTLSLLIVPIVVISASEAIRSVPNAQRQASYGMGATQWQTIRSVVLPRAMPGILTGTILSLARAIGETAPLLMIGAPTTVFSAPTGIESKASAMPLQVFEWAFSVKSALRTKVAPAGVVTLLIVLLAMNSLAVFLRNRYERST